MSSRVRFFPALTFAERMDCSPFCILSVTLRMMGKYYAKRPGIVSGASAFLSILLSKGVYYLLKWMVIAFGWMNMELISTGLWIQLLVALAVSVIFALTFRTASR